jgi:hypothetical protein
MKNHLFKPDRLLGRFEVEVATAVCSYEQDVVSYRVVLRYLVEEPTRMSGNAVL